VGDDIVAKALWSDPLMVAAPAWHPLLKHKRISLDEVLRYPMVPCDPHACGSHARQIQRVLRRVKQETRDRCTGGFLGNLERVEVY
jgi:DNA-binding transcriptional LysR family regulator